MKKTIFTIILLAAVTVMSAQTLQFEWDGTVYESGQTVISTYNEDFMEYILDMRIRNLSDIEQSVVVEREIVELPDGASSYFCWDMCFAPWIDLSPDAVAIPAQTLSETELAFHLMFDGDETGVAVVNYYAYNPRDPENKISLTVLAGRNANVAENTITLGQAYPNPASTQVHFDYNCNSGSNVNAVVYNLLGQEVKVQPVNGSHGRINIAVDDLQPGIYFCSIRVNDATVKTEKFIVKR